MDQGQGQPSLERLVNAVDTSPRYFTRADGVRIALVRADFYDAIHEEHTLRHVIVPQEGTSEYALAKRIILGDKNG